LFLLALCAIAAICQAHGKPAKAEFKRALGRTNRCFWILNVFKLLYKVSQSTSLMIYG